MTRIVTVATGVVLVALCWLPVNATQAQSAPQPGIRLAQATTPPDAAPRRRAPRRLPIYPRYQGESDGVYPRYYPGPDAVRVCSANLVQEYRPSGTVIVPRMHCFWRRS